MLVDPILAVWILFAVVGLAIGQAKGRLLAGFLFGLFLGPIGWILLLIGPNYGPTCPHCKGTVVAGAAVCRNCGRDLH